MPKKDKSSKKSGAGGTADAVRGAVERAFEGAGVTQKRTREVVDEVAHAAARVRAALEDLRLLEDVRGLRDEVDALARRVAALETAAGPAAKRTTSRSKAATTSGAKSTRSTKSSGATSRATKSSGGTSRATRSSGGTTSRSSSGRSTRSSSGRS